MNIHIFFLVALLHGVSADKPTCPTCPWGNPDHGPYPPPKNAPSGYQPIHRGNYFDMYGDWIETRYSEVYWTAQPALDLPAEIVKQYAGKAISFTGFEVDVVSGGVNGTDEWSVPEFEVYNHHYCATITGAAAQMTYIGHRGQDSLLRDLTRQRRHSIEVHPMEYEPREVPGASDESYIPTAHNFWQGNGGEHRKSFKHLPKGTGQLIESPEKFILQPMLINTHNPPKPGQSARDAFHAAPLPKASMAPPGANYSGLMECPCTTRVHKIITGFVTRNTETCANMSLVNAQECFDAAAQLIGATAKNLSVKEASSPSGCYIVASTTGNEVYYNLDVSSTSTCGVNDGRPVRALGSAASASNDLTVSVDLDERTGNATITMTGPSDMWFGVGFGAALMADAPYTIVIDGEGAVTEHKLANHMPGVPLNTTVDVVANSVGPAVQDPPRKMNHLGAVVSVTPGSDWAACEAKCMLTSVCRAWTYTPPRFSTVYNLDNATCTIRSTLQNNQGFTSAGWIDGMYSGEPDLSHQIRTVIMRRALKPATKDYYEFDARAANIPFIEAVGTTPDFQYHGKSRGGSTIVLVETGAPVCVCKGDKQGGSINGIPWADNCEDFPATTIKRDHNPSCSIDSYGGGMICCHHGVFLLDQEQAIPPETFRFRMKFRFWYEDPTPVNNSVAGPGLAYQNAFFMFRETEVAHGEYDVPKCKTGTPVDECVHEIVGQFQIKDTVHECKDRADVWCSPTSTGKFPQSQYIKLIHISPHCHGPACISMRMINRDTNETLCYTEPHYGSGDSAMDEAGYAAGIPPCLWGTEEEGLAPPPVVAMNTNITVIKRVNSTHAHYGVMAHWQMRGIWA